MTTISSDQLQTLKNNLKTSFIDKVRNLPEWSALITQKQEALEEADRLYQLLILQKIIENSAENRNEFEKLKNLPNESSSSSGRILVISSAYNSLFSFGGVPQLMAIYKQHGNAESAKKKLSETLVALSESYYKANPVSEISDQALREDIATLKRKLTSVFLEKVSELPAWQAFILEKNALLEEANRLCQLLTLQKIIANAEKNKNVFEQLKNLSNPSSRGYDAILIVSHAYNSLFSVAGVTELIAISKQLGNAESTKTALNAALVALSESYYEANPAAGISDQALREDIATLKRKLTPVFLEKVSALPAWQAFILEKDALLEEANRLCQLLTLQKIIENAEENKNVFEQLKNLSNSSSRGYDVILIVSHAYNSLFSVAGVTELIAISKQLGNSESTKTELNAALVPLSESYYEANPVAGISDQVLREHIAILEGKLSSIFIEKVSALPAWIECVTKKENLLDEVNRLSELLTLQTVIKNAETNKNEFEKLKKLPNEQYRDIESNAITVQAYKSLFSFGGPTELQKISQLHGNDVLIQNNLKDQLVLLSQSYFGAYLAIKNLLNEEELKNYIAMVKEKKPETLLEFKNTQSQFLIKLEEKESLLIKKTIQATADQLHLKSIELHQAQSRQLIEKMKNHEILLFEIEKTVSEEASLRAELENVQDAARNALETREKFEIHHSDSIKFQSKEEENREEIRLNYLSAIEAQHREFLETEKTLLDSEISAREPLDYESTLFKACNDKHVWIQEEMTDSSKKNENYIAEIKERHNLNFIALLEKYPNNDKVQSIVLKNNPQLALKSFSNERITELFLKDPMVLAFFFENCSKKMLLDLFNRITDPNAIYMLYTNSYRLYQLDMDIIKAAYLKNKAILGYITNPTVIQDDSFVKRDERLVSLFTKLIGLNNENPVLSLETLGGTFNEMLIGLEASPQVKENIIDFISKFSKLMNKESFINSWETLLDKTSKNSEKTLEKVFIAFINLLTDTLTPQQLSLLIKKFYKILEAAKNLKIQNISEEKKGFFSTVNALAGQAIDKISNIKVKLYRDRLSAMSPDKVKEHFQTLFSKASSESSAFLEKGKQNPRLAREKMENFLDNIHKVFLASIELIVGTDRMKEASQEKTWVEIFSSLTEGAASTPKEYMELKQSIINLFSEFISIFDGILKTFDEQKLQSLIQKITEIYHSKLDYNFKSKINTLSQPIVLSASIVHTVTDLLKKNIISLEDCSTEMQEIVNFMAMKAKIEEIIAEKIIAEKVQSTTANDKKRSIILKNIETLLTTETLIKAAANHAELTKYIENQLNKIKKDPTKISAVTVLQECNQKIKNIFDQQTAPKISKYTLIDFKTKSITDLENIPENQAVTITNNTNGKLCGTWSTIYNALEQKYNSLRNETRFFKGAEFSANVQNFYKKEPRDKDFNLLNSAQKLFIFIQYSDNNAGRTQKALKSLWKDDTENISSKLGTPKK